MNQILLAFKEIDKTKTSIVGGKGANLGELSRIEGIRVPDGFCISTEVFKRIVAEDASISKLLDQLSTLQAKDREAIAALSKKIRIAIEAIAIPVDMAEEISQQLSPGAYAVRSSATAEDLPTASFAGQQDTYLNVIGKQEILKHIGKCWASLFTERAITYRIQNGFDHRKVYLSVVIQKMVFPQVSGIMFTADPVSSNRKVISIDASFGLGEALVAGLVNADVYKIKNGEIIDQKISNKKKAIYALQEGGIKEQEIDSAQQNQQALNDEQVLQLEKIGRKIEAHFGSPQDIEWCLADGTFYIVQSRPITTLFPIPPANDAENHVYLSVGHQQMMTDPLKPLGLSFWQMTTRAPMRIAGGRLFVDVTPMLASEGSRQTFLDTFGKFDLLTKDAITTIIERDFIKTIPGDQKGPAMISVKAQPQVESDPVIVSELVARGKSELEELKQNIRSKSGPELFDFIVQDLRRLQLFLNEPKSMAVIMSGMNAASWINEKMEEWLGEKNVADTISLSVSNNVTSEMGLDLLDVADVIRPYPEVIAYLQEVKDDNFLHELVKYKGGKETRAAITNFLDKYGMRCAGEIDITKTRWSEKPTILLPMILANIKNQEAGAGKRKFEQGKLKAMEKEQELLSRLRQLPDGEQKAQETKRMIDLVRNFAGYREYPKYNWMCCYFVYKQALLKEVGQNEDMYYLSFEELREAMFTKKIDDHLISQRKDEYRLYKKLTPPRVITSDGEIVTGEYKRTNLPAGALVGLAVSSGMIEGRARVIVNMEDADLEDDDILVTAFTDPSWTPLFVSIKALVTEVGGLMSHGSVIAREYGLPAVVAVENATKLIKDGQRIRVHGTEGYVEILN